MDRHPSFKPSQVALALLIGCVVALGSLVHTVWAAPSQSPHRQSIPTKTPTPTATPTETPTEIPTKKPTSRPRTSTPTAVITTATPFLPETGGEGVQQQGTDALASAMLEPSVLVLLGGGFALFLTGLWLKVRRH